MAQLNVRVSGELLAEVRARASSEERGLGETVARALVLYLARDVDPKGPPPPPPPPDPRYGRLSGEKCRHPVTRRIGERCADCGRKVRP